MTRDAKYLAAAKRGDLATAGEMVAEEARLAGFRYSESA